MISIRFREYPCYNPLVGTYTPDLDSPNQFTPICAIDMEGLRHIGIILLKHNKWAAIQLFLQEDGTYLTGEGQTITAKEVALLWANELIHNYILVGYSPQADFEHMQNLFGREISKTLPVIPTAYVDLYQDFSSEKKSATFNLEDACIDKGIPFIRGIKHNALADAWAHLALYTKIHTKIRQYSLCKEEPLDEKLKQQPIKEYFSYQDSTTQNIELKNKIANYIVRQYFEAGKPYPGVLKLAEETKTSNNAREVGIVLTLLVRIMPEEFRQWLKLENLQTKFAEAWSSWSALTKSDIRKNSAKFVEHYYNQDSGYIDNLDVQQRLRTSFDKQELFIQATVFLQST